jgi:toxin ParE1/3/4
MKLHVARSAVADLDEIWAYLAEKESIEIAERVVNSLVSRFGILAENPRLGRQRSDLADGLRSFPVGYYRIYYRPETSGVLRILYVRHAARQERL